MHRRNFMMPFLMADDGGAGGGAPGAGEAGDGAQGGASGGTPPAGDQETKLPASADELSALLKAETEKAVKAATEALAADLQKKHEEEKTEAERMAKMTAAEKEAELTKKQQEQLSKKEQELARKELELKTVDLLKDKGLSLDFKPYVIGEDEKTTAERMTTFAALWQKALEEAVNERLKGKTPTRSTETPGGGNGSFMDAVTKNQYRK